VTILVHKIEKKYNYFYIKIKMFSDYSSENELKILIKEQQQHIENIKKEEQDYYERTVGNGQHYVCILEEEYEKLTDLEQQLEKNK